MKKLVKRHGPAKVITTDGLRSYGAAMTAVQVAGFVEKGAKVEIEATAVIPDA